MRLLSAMTCAAVLAVCSNAQNPGGLVDVYIVKVKPEKRSDFEAIGKKIADANRKYKGDAWVAYSVEYGEQNTFMMASVRENYAAIEKGMGSFMSAMKEGYGPNFMKLFQDMNNCAISSRSEVRRRRMDLSWNVPEDMAATEKRVGESRWLRVMTVRVRPGHVPAYEENLKALKAAFEKGGNPNPGFVSQVVAGQPAGVFYITGFGKSLADFDPAPGAKPLRELMGEEGYDRFQKIQAESVLMSESDIARLVPELSNPTEGIAKADPEFWNPKPAAPAAAKPKPAKTGM